MAQISRKVPKSRKCLYSWPGIDGEASSSVSVATPWSGIVLLDHTTVIFDAPTHFMNEQLHALTVFVKSSGHQMIRSISAMDGLDVEDEKALHGDVIGVDLMTWL